MSFLSRGRGKARPKPSGVRLSPNDAQHAAVDDLTKTIYIDRTKRSSDAFQAWLNSHLNTTGVVYHVVWEAFSDITRRREEIRQRGAAHHKPGEASNTARNQAISVLKIAATCRASDVHILRRREHTEIQFRIKKSLMVYRELNNSDGDALLVALYRLCSSQDNTIKPQETQDGGITGHLLDGTGLENVRLVRGPAYPANDGGGHMELRLQYREKSEGSGALPNNVLLTLPRRPDGQLKLVQYGFTEDQVDRLKYIATQPSGVLMLTGPTGSGKTTTIFELAKWQARTDPGKRLVAIEQPVEYPMPWAVQLEISNALDAAAAGKRFQDNLRYSLRMDPDRLIIGEIRDAEVALTAFDAAQTGHSVLTTLHIEDPFEFATRLQNMNFERLSFRVTCNSSVIRGIVAQRLLPILCDSCKEPWTPGDDRMPHRAAAALASWGDTSMTFKMHAGGCAHCQFTGIGSVTSVAEVVETDEELMNDLITKGIAIARRRFRSRPDVDTPMVEKAIALALQGKVDPWTILREVDKIPSKEQVDRDRRIGRAERARAAEEADRVNNDEEAA